MSRLPLNTLPAFREVAQQLNLRAAAETLHLTHSAVSQQIRVLEDQLGFPVFERRGRRVVLNPAGEVLLRSVQAALAQLDDGVQAASATAAGTAHQLRVTVLPSFAQRWLLPRMGRWHARHPNLTIEIEASPRLVDLERENFDIALRQGLGPWPGLDSEPLFDLSMLPVASPALAHQLIGEPLEALAQAPLLGDAAQWEDWFSQAGLRRQVVPVAIFNDFGILLQAAEQGMGVGLTRELLAADALLDGRLVRVAPRQAMLKEPQRYHIVYRPKSRQEPAVCRSE